MIAKITSPSASATLLIGSLVLLYCFIPLAVDLFVRADYAWITLSIWVGVAVICIAIGFHLPILDSRFQPNAFRFEISPRLMQAAIWTSFAIYVIVVLVTAKSIPLLSSLRGGTAAQIAIERGNFLKTREGWEAILPYMGRIYTAALLPYATADLFLRRHRFRFVAAILFVIYTLLALEKSLFVLALAPIVYLVAQGKILNYKNFFVLLIVCFGILYTNTLLARGLDLSNVFGTYVEIKSNTSAVDPEELPAGTSTSLSDYFSSKYRPSGALDHIFWRTIAVPVFTAADAVRVFEQVFHEKHMWGATSSILAFVTGLDRINYDAEVFAYQFGRSKIGRANSVYVTEAYVNFGWLGIVLFSLFVGLALRAFKKSTDDSFKAMWPLFCWNVFFAGLIGTLFSNGFLLLLLVGLFARMSDSPTAAQGAA